MNHFNKVGIFWLLFLVVYCTALISVVLFICQLGKVRISGEILLG